MKLLMQSKCNRIHKYLRYYIQVHCSLGEIIELINNIISIEKKSNSLIYCSFIKL